MLWIKGFRSLKGISLKIEVAIKNCSSNVARLYIQINFKVSLDTFYKKLQFNLPICPLYVFGSSKSKRNFSFCED